MKGWFSTRVGDRDYQAGWESGQIERSQIEADFKITVNDLDDLLRLRSGSADLSGTVLAPQLSEHVLTVTAGEFRLFDTDPRNVETWNMSYRMRLASQDGGQFRLEGTKVLHDDPGFDVWADTTTLYVRVNAERDSVSGAGILHLSAAGLLRELRTLKVIQEPDARKRRDYLKRFLAMFAGRLVHIYGPLDEDGRFWGKSVDRGPVEPKDGCTPDLVLWLDGRQRWRNDKRHDGEYARLQLTRFQGGDQGPVMLAPGFAMAARSFAMRTNPTNLVACLLDHKYDVWLFDYRASIELPSAHDYFTLDDIAREDWRDAVGEVVRRTNSEQRGVQVVGHCAGSVTFLMAMLDGLRGVRSAVCSQFTMYPRSWWFNRVKVRIPLPQFLQLLRVRTLSPGTQPRWWNKMLDVALTPVPVPRGERCGSALCRWVNLVYGMTHRHAQLNDATHRALVQSFGVGNLRSIEHLGLMIRKALVVESRGKNVYLPHADQLAIPIHFLVGRHNTIFSPATTDDTLHWLRRSNYPPSLYSVTELEDYSHLDCFIGEKAAAEVFPTIVDFLDST